MTEYVDIFTKDNHKFQAYLSQPNQKVKGGIVIIQEIFGVNDHIKEVCNLYSNHGYLTIAPCLFDRENKNIELDYDQEGITEGRRLKELLNELSINEIESSISFVESAGKVGVIGYCWGGSLSWKAACKFNNLSSSIIYYGGDVPKLKNLIPKCPTMCHFGELDQSIPIDDVKEFEKSNQNINLYTYPADHGFNCNHRNQYNKKCSDIALERSLSFLEKNLN